MARKKLDKPWVWDHCVVEEVIDGDTIDVYLPRTVGPVDIGFHGTFTAQIPFQQRFRLNRINAPRANSEKGKASTMYLKTLLSADEHADGLKMETFKPYKYGDEWMVEITLPNGLNISDQMVVRGYAAYWDGQGPRPEDA